jgi:hypothetical protein
MNGIERRQFEMLVRVRNFGNTHTALFASSPVAQQTLAAVSAAVDDLHQTDMQKMSASTAARANARKTARRTLSTLLVNATRLAKHLRADGRTVPGFVLPASRSDVAMITAGRQFTVDATAFDAEFTGHAIGPAHIAATTAAFEAAVNDQGMSRSDHVAARARIHDLIVTAIRGVRRLDVFVAHELGNDNTVQSAWTQLRRVEDPRTSRGGEQPQPTAAVETGGTPVTVDGTGPAEPKAA